MKALSHRIWQAGFTIIETMLAIAFIGLAFAMALGALTSMMQNTRSGSSQIRFIQESRIAEQKITAFVHQGKAIGVNSNYVSILTTNMIMAQIFYEDDDGNPDTVADNCIKYTPDMWGTGAVETICSHVSPIVNEPMFSVIPVAPNAAKFCFHLGDSTNAAYSTDTGKGFQGVEVRFTATPRNIQFFYQ